MSPQLNMSLLIIVWNPNWHALHLISCMESSSNFCTFDNKMVIYIIRIVSSHLSTWANHLRWHSVNFSSIHPYISFDALNSLLYPCLLLHILVYAFQLRVCLLFLCYLIFRGPVCVFVNQLHARLQENGSSWALMTCFTCELLCSLP